MPLRGASTALALGSLLDTSPAQAHERTKLECIASNEEGQDLRRDGKLQEAARRFHSCSAGACPTEVREDCAERLTEVEIATPTIAFDTKGPGGRTIAAVRVTAGALVVAERVDAKTAFPIDPGTYRFVFTTHGSASVTRELTIREGEKGRRVTVEFPASRVTEPPRVGQPNASGQPRWRTYAGYGFLTGAIVGAIVGTTALVRWVDQKADLERRCPAEPCNVPDPAAFHSDERSANTMGNVALVGLGSALLLGGVSLYLLFHQDPTRAKTANRLLHLTPHFAPWIVWD